MVFLLTGYALGRAGIGPTKSLKEQSGEVTQKVKELLGTDKVPVQFHPEMTDQEAIDLPDEKKWKNFRAGIAPSARQEREIDL